MHLHFICQKLEDINRVARDILTQCNDSKIFLFYGDLGAGKTTLIKAICQNLGYEGIVTSPTFSLINEYSNGNCFIYHMDLYRLKNAKEAIEIGLEEYLQGSGYCFIEWPETIIDLLDIPYYKVIISTGPGLERKIEVDKI